MADQACLCCTFNPYTQIELAEFWVVEEIFGLAGEG